jgi:hypothetical protein
MRGRIDEHPPLFQLFSVEDCIRPDHPLRDVKRRVDAQFTAAYSRTGRPSVPPERLLKALLLMALYADPSWGFLADGCDGDTLILTTRRPHAYPLAAKGLTHSGTAIRINRIRYEIPIGRVRLLEQPQRRPVGPVLEGEVQGTWLVGWRDEVEFVPRGRHFLTDP